MSDPCRERWPGGPAGETLYYWIRQGSRAGALADGTSARGGVRLDGSTAHIAETQVLEDIPMTAANR